MVLLGLPSHSAVGPMHHAHLILPLAADELGCSDARFVRARRDLLLPAHMGHQTLGRHCGGRCPRDSLRELLERSGRRSECSTRDNHHPSEWPDARPCPIPPRAAILLAALPMATLRRPIGCDFHERRAAPQQRLQVGEDNSRWARRARVSTACTKAARCEERDDGRTTICAHSLHYDHHDR